MISKIGLLACLLVAAPVYAELQALDDDTLSSMNGQGGVYLSGEFSINKDGGVLWSKPASNNPSTWTASQRSCATAGASTPENCGMRVAIRSEADGGWYVLDNLKGVFSFEGLTLRTRTINSGFNGDGATFNQDVLEFGLPNEVKFKDGSFAFGVANQGGWQNKSLSVANGGNPSYQQTNIFSAKIDGTIRMQGNVLIFPQN
ncbi:MAG: hypothetical protein KJ989_18620 [Gammaproteobacteria bacterium]|nr:hypothetical protein [Gammaproteobacteria bacterium]MBU2154660.1 hypothetical protein [Gammaproteobacteria bacterium]MBU2254057.1 hypothetical protein [Gammaproteobacteria bacterium]MBU2296219.1 hypothetical protein [Gammaproteobacteria bacterium]